MTSGFVSHIRRGFVKPLVAAPVEASFPHVLKVRQVLPRLDSKLDRPGLGCEQVESLLESALTTEGRASRLA